MISSKLRTIIVIQEAIINISSTSVKKYSISPFPISTPPKKKHRLSSCLLIICMHSVISISQTLIDFRLFSRVTKINVVEVDISQGKEKICVSKSLTGMKFTIIINREDFREKSHYCKLFSCKMKHVISWSTSIQKSSRKINKASNNSNSKQPSPLCKPVSDITQLSYRQSPHSEGVNYNVVITREMADTWSCFYYKPLYAQHGCHESALYSTAVVFFVYQSPKSHCHKEYCS